MRRARGVRARHSTSSRRMARALRPRARPRPRPSFRRASIPRSQVARANPPPRRRSQTQRAHQQPNGKVPSSNGKRTPSTCRSRRSHSQSRTSAGGTKSIAGYHSIRIGCNLLCCPSGHDRHLLPSHAPCRTVEQNPRSPAWTGFDYRGIRITISPCLHTSVGVVISFS
jgi:hypothetical protein